MSINDKTNQPRQDLPFWRQMRWVLIILFVLLAALPVLFAVFFVLNRQAAQTEEQVLAQLESVAKLKQDQITRWLNDAESLINLFLADVDRSNRFVAFTESSLREEAVLDVEEQEWLNTLLQQAVAAEPNINTFFLYNRRGEVIAASNPVEIGKSINRQPYFEPSLAGEDFVQAPYYQLGKSDPVMFITHPIFNQKGDLITGVLAAQLNVGVLDQIMLELAGLGETGDTYLVSPEFNFLVTSSRFEADGYIRQRAYHSDGIEAALQGESGNGIYGDYRSPSVPVFGVYRWLPKLQVALLAEVDEAEALAATNQSRNIVLFFTGGIILAAVLVGFVSAARIASPITNLTQVATSIAAGDFTQRAEVSERNEIGLLALSFNEMAEQLQTFITSLEDRIRERTQRLEVVAVLNERLSAILDFDQLLQEMVQQVKERFDYYHTHVYILDEQQQNLVMTAGVGEAGKQMKAEGHHIALNAPTSLVARAAREGEVVSVANVRESSDWLPNPLLPDTYSEMAVPIILAGQVVGVLDVQENEIAGFDEGDANVLRSLANQVAVAIRNARLFDQVETALTETHAAQERYLTQAWTKTKISPDSRHYLYTQMEATAVDARKRQMLTKIQQQAHTQNRPTVITTAEDGEGTSLLAPIALRGKVIGALQIHNDNTHRAWSDDDLAIMEAIAEQFAQTAENLRLFDETREQADFERVAGEITQKLREAPSLDYLVKTAAQELSRVLGASHSVVKIAPPQPQASPSTGLHSAANGQVVAPEEVE